MQMHTLLGSVALGALLAPFVILAAPRGASAEYVDLGPRCDLPESNAEALELLSNYYPGYWWDHTDLTVAVQAHPKATEAQLEAIHGAIASWAEVFSDCFEGRITITDVTGSLRSAQRAADIVVHYVPRAGGVVFGGYAVCGDHGCPNIMVRSDLPPSLDLPPYHPVYLRWLTLHELGHAFGLGHATNLYESTDLMGYGWPDLGVPVLSRCNVDALVFVFSWLFEGSEPHPPGEGPFDCGLD